MKRRVREAEVRDRRGVLREPFLFALVADLHDAPYDDILPRMRGVDAILVAGDLVERHSGGCSRAEAFLRDAPAVAPTWYALGNHERWFPRREEWLRTVRASGVRLIDDEVVRLRSDLVLGALSSARKAKSLPDAAPVEALAREEGYRLLICHHPEYYDPLVRGRGIDLTVAGHAHGGQVQLFGRGLFAPGQGIFPKYTHDFYDGGRLLVSRGLSNHDAVPRINDPCELILVRLMPGTGEGGYAIR